VTDASGQDASGGALVGDALYLATSLFGMVMVASASEGGITFLAMAKRPIIKQQRRKPSPIRLFRARFPNGTSVQRHASRAFTHAYLVLYERPDGKDGFQRGFCSSLYQAETKIETEIRWLSRNRHTLVEAFIVDVHDITGKIKDKS
jgi:hypothetical protein